MVILLLLYKFPISVIKSLNFGLSLQGKDLSHIDTRVFIQIL